MPDKPDMAMTAEKGANTLVLFFIQTVAPDDAQIGFEYPELPAYEHVPVPGGCPLIDVELEPGPIETDGLSDRSDVGLLKGKNDGQTPEGDIVRLVQDGFLLQVCQLCGE